MNTEPDVIEEPPDQKAHVERRDDWNGKVAVERAAQPTYLAVRKFVEGTGPEDATPLSEAEPVAGSWWVADPLKTLAQIIHEQETKPYDPHLGQVLVPGNLTGLLGGFARFRGTEAQNKAAARFKSLYERSQVGGSKACDPSVEPVDGGGINPESIFEIGADARKAYIVATKHIGPVDTKRAEYVIIGEHGPTAYARYRLRGTRAINGQVTSRLQVEFRGIMDRLSEHWGFQTK